MRPKSNLNLWREFQQHNQSLLGSSLPTINNSCKRVIFFSFFLNSLKKAELFSYYQQPQLITSLKKMISKQLLGGLVNPDQMLITQGAQSALFDLFHLLKKQQPILIEKYNYVGLFHLFEVLGLNYQTIPNLYELKNSELEFVVKENKPGLIYLQPDNANPTGASLSQAKRKFVINLAKKYNFQIIEDQSYRYLTSHKNLLPSLNEMSPKKVIAVGSLSKLFCPALRIGWIVAKPDIIKKISLMQEVRYISHSNILLDLATKLIDRPTILEKNIKIYKKRVDKAICLLKRYKKCRVAIMPVGGYFLWLEIDKINNEQKEHLSQLLPNGVIFSYDSENSSCFYRLSLGQIADKQLNKQLEVIGEVIG